MFFLVYQTPWPIAIASYAYMLAAAWCCGITCMAALLLAVCMYYRGALFCFRMLLQVHVLVLFLTICATDAWF